MAFELFGFKIERKSQETPKSNADTNKQNSKAEDILAMIRARQQK